ncbi:excinuclease ABC subunit UvrC [Chloroflexota bacterium]
MGLQQFEDRLRALPGWPGVYLFHDEKGNVLYVGKAANLRQRVRAYFATPHTLTPKLRKMAARLRDIDYIVTDSEQEALILECNLIKQHHPRYNVRLKDDKSYPYIKVALNEEWPRVFLARRFEQDGSRYFGPFASAGSVRKTLDLMKKLFRYCSTSRPITAKANRPCFDYFINRCVGACSGEICRQDYLQIIDHVIRFLEGKQEAVVRHLRWRMKEAADNLEFERASYLRDQLRAVEDVVERQKVVSTARGDEDVIALARESDEACAQVFFVRGGKLIGREHFVLEGTLDETLGQVTTSFIMQFYAAALYIPPTIVLGTEPENMAVVAEWLGERAGCRVQLIVPQRGERKRLLDMVRQNAEEALERLKVKWLADSGKAASALNELREQLRLPRLPNRMECYDISDIRGTSAVGSMVVFDQGRPKPAHYRRFRIKAVQGSDDYAMMQEVLRRRFARKKTGDGSWAAWPDLVLIDGGKGHLNAVLEVVRQLELDDIPLASIAKEEEGVFLPERAEPLVLPRNSQALYLLQRVRDEAHRFALSYHLKVRRTKALTSGLDAVPGVGPKRKRALLRKFGSLRAIKEAGIEDLAAVPGITRSLGERVKEYL